MSLMKWIVYPTAAWFGWKWYQKRERGHVYTPAKTGDTLEAVAARFGVTPAAIAAANGPGFARIYAPDGSPVPFKLPADCKDSGPVVGAMGVYQSP